MKYSIGLLLFVITIILPICFIIGIQVADFCRMFGWRHEVVFAIWFTGGIVSILLISESG